MRKSRTVPIAALSALALAFSACGEEETAYCVDEENRAVDNANCDDEYNASGTPGFFWLFLAGNRFGGRPPAPGQRLPTDGAERIAANDRVALQSKGGFGSRARGSGIGRTVSAGG